MTRPSAGMRECGVPEAAAGEFILFRTGEASPRHRFGGCAGRVGARTRAAAPQPVRGTLDAVQGLLPVLPGWQAEPDSGVRDGV
jgi:hypothetical protein